VIPEADYASDSEEEEGEEEEEVRRRRMRSEEEEKQQQPICRILWFLILTIHRTARRRRWTRSPIDDTPRKRSRR
jgi:hypothetical protein